MDNRKETILGSQTVGEKIKSSVDYRILIKDGGVFYKIGTMIIKTHKGDIFYTPSHNYLVNQETLEKNEIDHISWHINGQVHIKKKECIEKYDIVQRDGERQKLHGYSNMKNI